MATHTVTTSKVITLSGTTVDTVTFPDIGSKFTAFLVMNTAGTGRLTATVDGTTTPTDGGADMIYVEAGMFETIRRFSRQTDGSVVLKFIGNGNEFTVRGLNAVEAGD
jgi:2-methylisocitrate lyase-like PEP mutase family enzyme